MGERTVIVHQHQVNQHLYLKGTEEIGVNFALFPKLVTKIFDSLERFSHILSEINP